MGLFSTLLNVIGIGGVSLKNATKSAPNSMGCYKIYYNGELVYVGKAEDGVRKRFVQYYNGTTISYSSGRKIHENRDKVTVNWKVLSTREECRSVEKAWIDKYHPAWNKQSGWFGY